MRTQQQLRTEWIKRLRSGTYIQGQNHLKAEGKHCCLGVACEILVEEGRLTTQETGYNTGGGTRSLRTSFNGNGATLPDEVVAYFGMHDTTGRHNLPGEWALTALNDGQGKTFSEIADALETGEYWTP